MAPKPMTAGDVSRLLGRAAFGATAADLDLWTGREYADLVEALVTGSAHPNAVPLADEPQRIALENDPDLSFKNGNPARSWWLERMRTTPFPLLERMTLLWHNHFATAVSIPPFVSDLVRQNQTLRANALGSFHTMCEQITVDQAMLYWLNGFHNTIPRPNENYAREFFELFTLGKRPQVYTEKDIREAARAFTGWYVNSSGQAVFAETRHDKGAKRILGQRVTNLGDREYLRVVEIALAQPVSYRFIAWKLVANLCYVPKTPNLLTGPGRLITKVADSLKSSDWNIAAGVRTLLLDDEFRYSPANIGRQHVRQPVESVVHATKIFGVNAGEPVMLSALERMGQALFNPVNVGGWPMGESWVSAVSAIARYDAALAIHQRVQQSGAAATLPAPDDLAAWAKRLGLAGFGQNTTNAVAGYLRRASGASVADRQAGVLALLLSSPEWVVM